MESVLVVITLGSLAMTIALALLLVRLMRAERRRSNARVALLRDLADDAARQQADRVNPEMDWDRGDLVADEIDDFDPADSIGSRPSADLFVRPQARSAWPRRILVAATIALVAGLGAFSLRTTSSNVMPGFVARNTQQTAATQTPGLLELVSLKQTQDGGSVDNHRTRAESARRHGSFEGQGNGAGLWRRRFIPREWRRAARLHGTAPGRRIGIRHQRGGDVSRSQVSRWLSQRGWPRYRARRSPDVSNDGTVRRHGRTQGARCVMTVHGT